MVLYIKYMVSERCKTSLKDILKGMQLHFIIVELGKVEILENLDPTQLHALREKLIETGLDLLDDKNTVLINKLNRAIIAMFNSPADWAGKGHASWLSETMDQDYNHLSHVFSQINGSTLQSFILFHRIEKVKELLLYNELSLTEIADKLNFSSVAHLSNQFKKTTGLPPMYYRDMKQKRDDHLQLS